MSVDKVFTFGPKNIFVFGSNEAGIHGAGAALTAAKFYGAIQGQGFGLMGNSFGIPTKDRGLRTLQLEKIQRYVDLFLDFVHDRKDLNFFLTKIGCGLAGYTEDEIAPLFKNRFFVNTIKPTNIEMPNGWSL